MHNTDEKPYRRKPIGPFAIVSADIYANRKIRKAGRDGRDVFVFALTRNAARGRTGSFQASELDPDYVADMLQIDAQTAAQGLQRAIDAGLLAIDGEDARIVGWDETWARQAIGESEARKLRREKSKTQKETKKQKENRSRYRYREVRTSSGHGPDKTPRASRLASDWKPREEERSRAQELGVDPDREARDFRDHHEAKGSTFIDWNAAFRTWLSKAEQYGRGRKGPRSIAGGRTEPHPPESYPDGEIDLATGEVKAFQ